MTDVFSVVMNQMPLDYIKSILLVEDSRLIWKKNGKPAGSLVKGYLRFEHKYKTYANHNILWILYNQKQIPDGFVVDHLDGDPLNNCADNLRIATKGQNCYNSTLYKNNKSGVKGVCWDRESGKWLAQCRVNGKNYKIGRFLSIETASAALRQFREENHQEFTNHG